MNFNKIMKSMNINAYKCGSALLEKKGATWNPFVRI